MPELCGGHLLRPPEVAGTQGPRPDAAPLAGAALAFASIRLARFANSFLVRRRAPSGRNLARGAALNRLRFDTMIAASERNAVSALVYGRMHWCETGEALQQETQARLGS